MKTKTAFRVLAMVLILTTSLTLLVQAQGMTNFKKSATYADTVFGDVAKSQWYYAEVANAYRYGLAGGVGGGKFNPSGKVTIAEAVTFMVRVNCIYSGADPLSITPVDAAVWYSGYQKYAIEQGLLQADEFEGQYTRFATRGELGHILSRALPAEEFTALNKAFTAVPDMDSAANYNEDILTLFRAGIVTGSDVYANFKPHTNITRAEAIAIVNRVVDIAQRKQFVPYVGNVKINSLLSLRPDGSVQLTVSPAGTYKNGGKLLFKSSNSAIATVSADGTVKALALGTAKVWATESNGTKNSNECIVTVVEQKKLSSVEVYKAASLAVFMIETFDSDGESSGLGTGFFVKSDGTAYTNLHVVDYADSVRVKTVDGKYYNDVYLIGYDRLNDLAVIKVNASNPFPTVTLGNSDEALTGERVYCIGNPLGIENTITEGMLSSIKYQEKFGTYTDAVYMQISAPVSPGNSGGVVINEYGEVIGIPTWGFLDGQNINFAMHINTAKEVTLFLPVSFSNFYDKLFKDIPAITERTQTSTGSNISLGSAMQFKSGDTVNGTLADYNVEQYYSVTTDFSGVLSLCVFPDKNHLGKVSIYMVDENGKVIDSSYSDDDGYDFADFYIKEAGTYRFFVSINEKSVTNATYSLYGYFIQ